MIIKANYLAFGHINNYKQISAPLLSLDLSQVHKYVVLQKDPTRAFYFDKILNILNLSSMFKFLFANGKLAAHVINTT